MMLRYANWMWVVLLLGASTLLYHTSYRVQQLERQVKNAEIARIAELENIHVLDAEWAYLVAPARLQKLATKYLPLRQVAATQIVPMRAVAALIPPREMQPAGMLAFKLPSRFNTETRLLASAGDR